MEVRDCWTWPFDGAQDDVVGDVDWLGSGCRYEALRGAGEGFAGGAVVVAVELVWVVVWSAGGEEELLCG